MLINDYIRGICAISCKFKGGLGVRVKGLGLFKEPFNASVVRINPTSSANDLICLRAELYGCDPNPGNLLFSVNIIFELTFFVVSLVKWQIHTESERLRLGPVFRAKPRS